MRKGKVLALLKKIRCMTIAYFKIENIRDLERLQEIDELYNILLKEIKEND